MTIVDTRSRIAASHRLGTDISSASSVDEALAIAALDWSIEEHAADNVILMGNDGMTSTRIPGHRFFLRSDNKVTLNVGGGRYVPVDNRAAFAAADAAVSLGARFAAAGERKDGRIAYLELDLPDATVHVGGKDLVTAQLQLRTAHDGSARVVGAAKMRRLICMNGMGADIGVPVSWAIPHTGSAHDRLGDAERLTKGVVQYANSFAAVADHMLDTPMSEREFTGYIDRLYPEPDVEDKRARGIWERRREELLALFLFAETNDLGRSSRWGAYSAVTEWLDWGAKVQGGDAGRAARQFDEAHQGVKNRAIQLLAA
jgi:phage/plasmid-like protein (TIGR03299 family)